MEKKYLSCLKYSLLLLTIVFIQCKKVDPRTENIKKHIKNNYGISINSNIDRIVILNDIGCGNCIYSFSEYIKENIDDSNTMIVINSRGANINLEEFNLKKKNNPNIIIKYSPIQNPDDIFYQSGIIHMNKNRVDTIFYINENNITDQLLYTNKIKANK